MDSGKDQRFRLAAAHRLTVRESYHEGTWNHFSLTLDHHPDQIFLTPGDTHFSKVCASNLAVLGAQNTQISGPIAPNKAAWIIHYPIHQARPDLKCLMHLHTPYATALGMCADLTFDERASQAAIHFYQNVAYFDLYDGPLRDESEGQRMADALGDKRILVMRGHGVMVGGATVGQAWHNLYLFERACMYQMIAMAAGQRRLTQVPEDVAEMGREYALSPVWDDRFEALVQTLDTTEPDYRH
ncbi:class II aldolase/adducin family protein [Roseovarius sp. 2305UL8-3]|uniref:class II aldolase/adducin family protein n=1 Tax=Roseovarius conchicola TaxID=3121636 RepID=UPI0035270EFF